jgi:hypothetical protein
MARSDVPVEDWRRGTLRIVERDAGLSHRRRAPPDDWCRLSPVAPISFRLSRRTPRVVLTAFLLVTLMWAQHEMQRHTLQHVADQLQRHHEPGLQSPEVDVPCVECSLLAGGSHAVPGSAATVPASAVGSVRIAVSFVSRSVAASSYYSSRAPPVLL